MPFAQFVISPGLVVGQNLPAGHEVHVISPAAAVSPAKQATATARVLSAHLWPTGQVVHETIPAAEYEPSGQSDGAASVNVQLFPAGHGKHVAASTRL